MEGAAQFARVGGQVRMLPSPSWRAPLPRLYRVPGRVPELMLLGGVLVRRRVSGEMSVSGK